MPDNIDLNKVQWDSPEPINVKQVQWDKPRTAPVAPKSPVDDVPEWGRNNPNLYGLYGAAKGVLDKTFIGEQWANRNKPLPTLADAARVTPEMQRQAFDNTVGWVLPGGTAGKAVSEQVFGQKALPSLSSIVAKGIGTAGKQVIGRLTGAGSGMVDEAIASGMKSSPFKTTTNFSKAMRGKMDGEEVVDLANSALGNIKNARMKAYQDELQKVQANNAPIDMTPIRQEASDLMQRYGIKVDPATGTLDLSRIAMNKAGRRDIKGVLDTINNWGKQAGDDTAVGLDALKRQLDDFYSDSSQARQFVSALRDRVRKTIVDSVKEYDTMTKGYAEATKLIKDIESGLMMRKNGMTGRVTKDQTLRRLTSAMRDNFTLRNEMVQELGARGAEDVAGAIAGHTASSWVPRGIEAAGLGSGTAILTMINPKMWPMLAGSSPRVAGEFLQGLGYSKQMANKIVRAIPQGMKTGAKRAAVVGAVANKEPQE